MWDLVEHGKSHHAQEVASENGIDYIIDDAILIHKNKVIAGKSAKTEPTKIGSVKSAIFNDTAKCELMKRAIKSSKIDKLLILGTSDGMVEKIAENLGLPKISKTIYIEEVSTKEQMEEARRMRMVEGKHVVPVPTLEIKEQFSGYFMDPLKIFEKKDKKYHEKSIIRPTFSYLGNFYISDKVIKDVIMYTTKDIEGVTRLIRVNIEKFIDGINLYLDINVQYGYSIPKVSKTLQDTITKEVVYATGINIFGINVKVKGIDIVKKD